MEELLTSAVVFIRVQGVARETGASVALYGLSTEVGTTSIVHLTLTGSWGRNRRVKYTKIEILYHNKQPNF